MYMCQKYQPNLGMKSMGAFKVTEGVFHSNYSCRSKGRHDCVLSRDVRAAAEIRTLDTWPKNVLDRGTTQPRRIELAMPIAHRASFADVALRQRLVFDALRESAIVHLKT